MQLESATALLDQPTNAISASLERFPREEWPEPLRTHPNAPDALWWSSDYLVALAAENALVTRMVVARLSPDAITWDDLQALKTAVGFGEWDALEIYPSAEDERAMHGQRHLLILHQPFPLTLRKEHK